MATFLELYVTLKLFYLPRRLPEIEALEVVISALFGKIVARAVVGVVLVRAVVVLVAFSSFCDFS